MNKKLQLFLVLLSLVLIVNGAFALNKNFKVEETEKVKLNTEASDFDGDTLTYSYSEPFDENGEWQTTYGDAGEYQIQVKVSDGQEETVETITLVVTKKNRKPELSLAPIKVKEGEKITLNLPEKDLDGDILTYSLGEPFNNERVWQTNFLDAGTYEVKGIVSDGEFEKTFTINIEINNVDRPPQLNVPLTLNALEGETFNYNIIAKDPDKEEVTVTIEGLPEEATFDGKKITWIPSFDVIKNKETFLSPLLKELGVTNILLKDKVYNLLIKACSKEICTEKEVQLTLSNVNREPQLTTSQNITVTEKEKIILNVSGQDPDGDKIRYSFSSPLNHKGEWKTKLGDAGQYTVFVSANDGLNQIAVPVGINILKDNHEPKIKVKKDKFIVNENEQLSFEVTTKDKDDDEVVLSLENYPVDSSFENGTFKWTPSAEIVQGTSPHWWDNLFNRIPSINKRWNNHEEIVFLEFTANDMIAETIHPVKITIKNVNQGPKIVDYLPAREIKVDVNKPVLFHVSAVDKDSDFLTYKWSFGLGEIGVGGTDTIERTFVRPGKKYVKVIVSDGKQSVKKEWAIEVKDNEEVKETIERTKFNVYFLEG